MYSTQSTLDPKNVTRYENATIGLFEAEGRKMYTPMIRVCDYIHHVYMFNTKNRSPALPVVDAYYNDQETCIYYVL